MPKEGYCLTIFYDSKDEIACMEVSTTSEAKHKLLAFDVGVETRNMKVYRLGPLLGKRVSAMRDAAEQRNAPVAGRAP